LEFEQQLVLIEAKEKRNVAELDVLMKELNEIQRGEPAVKEDSNSRKDFIRMLNNLGRAKFIIDKDKTDMEELSLMIKQYNEDFEQQNPQ
jgi:hypothetical protein